MVSKKIKYARTHLSSKKHIAMLATPLWRRVQNVDVNAVPHPFTVPRSALRAYATKRIKIMARPKTLKKYERRSTISQASFQRGNRENHAEESKKRLQELALPKKSQLLRARMYTLSLGNRHMTENINNLLKGIKKSKYQNYRIICNTLHQRAIARRKKIRKKLFKALKNDKDWERHKKALKKLAAPKRVKEPPEPTAKQTDKKQFYSKEHMNFLAKPMHRMKVDLTDPFAVKQSALTYIISQRMRKLAREKNIPDPPFNIPGEVKPGALLMLPSPRIVELAKAIVRPLGLETHHNMEAFSVSPFALKARCSPRLKILAKPKKRPKP